MFRCRALVRFFATEAGIKSVPGNKPPALGDTPAGRYAGALFFAASTRESLDVVLEDVKFINELFKESVPFRDFVKTSGSQKTAQKEVLNSIGEANLNPVTISFLNTLIDSGRLSDLPKITEKYQEYYKILNKEEDIRIISAKELTAEEKDRVVESVKKGKKGVQFKVSYEVDPTILGGLQIYSGSTFLDCSLRSRLDRLRSEIRRLV